LTWDLTALEDDFLAGAAAYFFFAGALAADFFFSVAASTGVGTDTNATTQHTKLASQSRRMPVPLKTIKQLLRELLYVDAYVTLTQEFSQ
jgi:hypothetical protein